MHFLKVNMCMIGKRKTQEAKGMRNHKQFTVWYIPRVSVVCETSLCAAFGGVGVTACTSGGRAEIFIWSVRPFQMCKTTQPILKIES